MPGSGLANVSRELGIDPIPGGDSVSRRTQVEPVRPEIEAEAR
jgi:hypothetical protein